MTVFLAFSERGMLLAEKAAALLRERGEEVSAERCASGKLGEWTRRHFQSGRSLVYVGALGIAARAVAPFVSAKTQDPAVVVLDEAGRFCIPLLSGHLGGANALAAELAALLGALPVITTATDLRGLFAADAWAREQGLRVANPAKIKEVSSRVLAGERLRLRSDVPIGGTPAPEVEIAGEDACDIHVSASNRPFAGALHLVPPIYTLGAGCRKGVDAFRLERAFEQLMQMCGLHRLGVRRVCTIDLKRDEPGLVEFARRHALPLMSYSCAELAQVPGEFASSEFVRSVAGVDNVCERSAVLGAGEGGRLVHGKKSFGGITLALAVSPARLTF